MEDATKEPEREMLCGLKCEFKKDARKSDVAKELENQINFGLESIYEEGKRKDQNGKNLEHPVLAKLLSKSHVSSGFLLHLHTPFCKRHLPEVDTVIVLEIETGERYETKYLARWCALSGGWRRFSIDMELEEGDLVAFELVEARRFKVYIIRKKSSTINLPTLLNLLHAQDRPNVADGNKELIVYKRSEGHLQGSNSSKSLAKRITFSDITGFQDFKAVMSEMLQDHVLPENTLQIYYKLCTKQNNFLHAGLLTGKNPRLLAETVKRAILETVNIANALETCDLTKFLENFADWNQTLMHFEAVGMNLSFLSARLHQLHTIAFDSEAVANRGRYIEACCGRARVEIEVMKLEWTLSRLKDASCEFATEAETLASSKLTQCKDEIRDTENLLADFAQLFDHYDTRIETLKMKTNNHEIQFQEAVSAPW